MTAPAQTQLGEAVQQGLLALLLPLADTKQRLGFQFSHWVTGTPALEGAVGAAALTQDELGHARSLYPLIRSLPGAPESLSDENDLQSRRARLHPRALDEKWDTWLKLVAVNVTLDAALHEVFGVLRDSSFTPLAPIAGKINQEERFHRIFGDTWLARIGEQGGEMKDRLQAAIVWAYPTAYLWFGPEDGAGTRVLVEAGVLTEPLNTVRTRWQEALAGKLDRAGLTLPPTPDLGSFDAERRDRNA